MRFGSIAVLLVGAAAGYAAARQLLAEDGIPERVPAEARARLEGPRARLLRWRERAREGLVEARAEREAAAEALMRQYHEATERETSSA